MKKLTIEISETQNYPSGHASQDFELLSPVWAGSSIVLPLREEEGGTKKRYEVTGWDMTRRLGPTSIHVARVRTETGKIGYIIYGDTAGVRVLDKTADPETDGDEYLPSGHGRPFMWIAQEDAADLPEEVRTVVEQEANPEER